MITEIVRLPSAMLIDGKHCIKAYATDFACVYLNYGANGFDTLFKVYAITRVNKGEVLGSLLATHGELTGAIDFAGKQT
jgi:hypothetical protein